MKEELLREIEEIPNEGNMFDRLPEGLSEDDKSKIVEFVEEKELKQIGYGRILPYRVILTDSGDIKITLVIYNGGEFQLNLPQMPLTLIDGNKSVIMAELVDLNAVVDCGKIGVIETIISKEKFKEKTINLEEWEITFIM